ncbi:hypothetical protein HDV01_001157 [Terramyces sp. JEL0728]|nr:hypothetical protein HDV01_001157 [Terramyces sp. JEL0728]
MALNYFADRRIFNSALYLVGFLGNYLATAGLAIVYYYSIKVFDVQRDSWIFVKFLATLAIVYFAIPVLAILQTNRIVDDDIFLILYAVSNCIVAAINLYAHTTVGLALKRNFPDKFVYKLMKMRIYILNGFLLAIASFWMVLQPRIGYALIYFFWTLDIILLILINKTIARILNLKKTYSQEFGFPISREVSSLPQLSQRDSVFRHSAKREKLLRTASIKDRKVAATPIQPTPIKTSRERDSIHIASPNTPNSQSILSDRKSQVL